MGKILVRRGVANDFTSRIRRAWQSSLEGLLETGRLLTEAKRSLPHGEFLLMVERDLPFKSRMAEMLMRIANDERLANPQYVANLPPHIGTLYDLTRLDDLAFRRALNQGYIRPDMQRREAVSILKARHQNIKGEHARTETFRTPSAPTDLLLAYVPHWFTGRGLDPSAGDGRMIREIIRRGNRNSHALCDIRSEERKAWKDLKLCERHIGDYLDWTPSGKFDFLITNPPFVPSQHFVAKALHEVNGMICILQSLAFQGTAERSRWLKFESGLRYVLNLPTRPRWELDSGEKPTANIWQYAWFVFEPGYSGLPQMDWLLEEMN